MSMPQFLRAGWAQRANAAIERWLYRISVYGIPVAISAVSLVAFTSWDRQYEVRNADNVEFRVLEQTGEALNPGQAMALLATYPLVQFHDTHLSELPFWFNFTVASITGNEPAVPPSTREASALLRTSTRLTSSEGSSE